MRVDSSIGPYRIVSKLGEGSGLLRVAPTGGPVEQLTKPDGAGNGYAHVFPVSLPGTNDLLFGFWGQTFYGARYSAAARTSKAVTTPVRLLAGVPLYAGGFLMGNDGSGGVLATRWTPDVTDPVTLTTPVLEHVQWGLNYDRSWLAVSNTGTAVYVAGNPNDRHVVWVDRQGRETAVTAEPDLVHQATLSRDGTRVAWGSMRSQWTVDLRSGARTRLISEFRSWHGAWLPGDERLAVSTNKEGDWDLYTIAATGGEMTPLLKRPWAQHVMAVAPDGAIVFLERNPVSGSDLLVLTPDKRVVPLLVTPYNEFGASLSPDGRFVAYVTDESGRNEVFVMPMAGGTRVPVSVEGGTGPVWSRDGHDLFYRGGGDELADVQIRIGPSGVSLGERRKLLDLAPYDSGFLHEFDVSPDGQRFLVIRTDPGSRPYRLDVIVNWFEELTKRMGEGTR